MQKEYLNIVAIKQVFNPDKNLRCRALNICRIYVNERHRRCRARNIFSKFINSNITVRCTSVFILTWISQIFAALRILNQVNFGEISDEKKILFYLLFFHILCHREHIFTENQSKMSKFTVLNPKPERISAMVKME